MDQHAKGVASLLRPKDKRPDVQAMQLLCSGTSLRLDEPSVAPRKWISSTSHAHEENEASCETVRYIDRLRHATLNELQRPGHSDASKIEVGRPNLRIAGSYVI